MNLSPVALGVAILAALLSATIWLSFAGAPLGFIGLALGALALRGARKEDRGAKMAIAAIVLSLLAILLLPMWLVACNDGLSCV